MVTVPSAGKYVTSAKRGEKVLAVLSSEKKILAVLSAGKLPVSSAGKRTGKCYQLAKVGKTRYRGLVGEKRFSVRGAGKRDQRQARVFRVLGARKRSSIKKRRRKDYVC